MILSDLKRFENLYIRDNLKIKEIALISDFKRGLMPLNPDEEDELKELRGKILEHAGEGSDSAGFTVVSNYKWIFRVYEEAIELGGISQDEGLERKIFWKSVEFIEDYVYKNATKSLLVGDEGYYRVLSMYLNSDELLSHLRSRNEWRQEVIIAKWGILRRKLKEEVKRLVDEYRSDAGVGLDLSVEQRVEPIFNKVLKQINSAIDADDLTQGEKLKIFDKLSGLLADVKGERKVETGVQVTHNNVFAVIMQDKGDVKALQGRAKEVLAGEGYLLE